MPPVLCMPLIYSLSHLLPVGISDQMTSVVALPSKRPSSPGGSLKTVESLQRHVKYDQDVFWCTPVQMTAFAPQHHDIHTHSWSSHEDPGDHHLRNGLLSSFR